MRTIQFKLISSPDDTPNDEHDVYDNEARKRIIRIIMQKKEESIIVDGTMIHKADTVWMG